VIESKGAACDLYVPFYCLWTAGTRLRINETPSLMKTSKKSSSKSSGVMSSSSLMINSSSVMKAYTRSGLARLPRICVVRKPHSHR
jgi:hypothetical protein